MTFMQHGSVLHEVRICPLQPEVDVPTAGTKYDDLQSWRSLYCISGNEYQSFITTDARQDPYDIDYLDS